MVFDDEIEINNMGVRHA